MPDAQQGAGPISPQCEGTGAEPYSDVPAIVQAPSGSDLETLFFLAAEAA